MPSRRSSTRAVATVSSRASTPAERSPASGSSRGFRMITVANDLLALRSGLVAELELARKADADGTDTASPY